MINEIEAIRSKYHIIRDEMTGYDARLVLDHTYNEVILFADNYDVEETFHVVKDVGDMVEFKRLANTLRFSGCGDLIIEEI